MLLTFIVLIHFLISRQASAFSVSSSIFRPAALCRMELCAKKKLLISEELMKSLQSEFLKPNEDEINFPPQNFAENNSSNSFGIGESKLLDNNNGSVTEVSVEETLKRSKPGGYIRLVTSKQPKFVSLGLDKVSLVFGGQTVLKQSSLSVSTGQRVGLVGANGAGKTVQLRILSGELEPTTGEIVKSSNELKIAYLRQEILDQLKYENTLFEELMTVFQRELENMDKVKKLENSLQYVNGDIKKTEQILQELENSKALLDSSNHQHSEAYYKSRVDRIIDMLGFSKSDSQSKVATFSGGWKMRIAIAKIMLREPNVLLLDEPTNHLDLESVVWMESFLQQQQIPMIIVSHDREFLNKVCNRIVEVEEGVTVPYNGNFEFYLANREARLTVWREKFDKQSKFVQEEENWIRKARNDPAMSGHVKHRQTMLEKFLSSEQFIARPPKERRFRLRFPPAPRSSDSVVVAKNVGHSYGSGVNKDSPSSSSSYLFRGVDLRINKGERIGLIGPNGCGKSTFLRLLLGLEEPSEGHFESFGKTVKVNYFQQSTADMLDVHQTLYETIRNVAGEEVSMTDIRSVLGQFLFKGDMVDKPVGVLSGGEKTRLALCKILFEPANLLILDEPTNHLDICTKEVLEEALQYFQGSLVVVSHDRYFLSQTVNRILVFESGTITSHDCDYAEYIRSHEGLESTIMNRQVSGDAQRITNARQPVVIEEKKSMKNFGGSGVTSGKVYKGIKNAKRYHDN